MGRLLPFFQPRGACDLEVPVTLHYCSPRELLPMEVWIRSLFRKTSCDSFVPDQLPCWLHHVQAEAHFPILPEISLVSWVLSFLSFLFSFIEVSSRFMWKFLNCKFPL